MPWTVADVEEHKKGLSDKQKVLWVKVANPALAACEKAGRSDCEASAIRQASAVAGDLNESDYTISQDGTIVLGEASKQEQPGVIRRALDVLGGALHRMEQAEASAELRDDFTALIESSVRKDGTMPIKIIAPGWGRTGYYGADVLERDAGVYARGTHMYLNHPTASEAADRPERDVKDLVGTLASDGRWEANGQAGPGVYADAEVIEGFRDGLAELAPHIGLSHRAYGDAEPGDAEGREGTIVKSIVKAESVDFVTKAAAGGQIMALMESARARLHKPKEERNMPTEEELKEAQDGRAAAEKERDELKEAGEKKDTELARLQEAGLIRQAKVIAVEALGKVEHLPEAAQKRLVESLTAKPPLKDGALDKDAFDKLIEEAAKNEIAYFAELTESGSVRGMGESGGGSEADHKALEESWKNMHPDWTEAQIKTAVEGR